MQSHVVTWLSEDLHMKVVETILVEMMIFAECHSTEDIYYSLAGCRLWPVRARPPKTIVVCGKSAANNADRTPEPSQFHSLVPITPTLYSNSTNF